MNCHLYIYIYIYLCTVPLYFNHCYTCLIYGSFRPEIKYLYLYLPVNASMDIPYCKSGVFPMPAFTKSTSFQTLETFQTMYITIKQIPWHSLY